MGPSQIFPLAIDAIFSDPNPDGYIIIPVIPSAAIEPWRAIGFKMKDFFGDIKLMREKVKDKPVIAILLGDQELEKELEELCGDTILSVRRPEIAGRIMSALYQAGNPVPR